MSEKRTIITLIGSPVDVRSLNITNGLKCHNHNYDQKLLACASVCSLKGRSSQRINKTQNNLLKAKINVLAVERVDLMEAVKEDKIRRGKFISQKLIKFNLLKSAQNGLSILSE